MGVIKFVSTKNVFEIIQACQTAEIVGLDTETTALHPRNGKIRLIQLAVLDVVYILDCWRTDPRILLPLFDGTVRFIGHNLAFDLRFLWSVGLRLPHGKRLFCSMIAEQILSAGLMTPKGYFSLQETLPRHTPLTIDKSEQTSRWDGDLSQDQYKYAGYDAACLIPLYYALVKKIEDAKLTRTMMLEMRALPGIVWMTMTGIQLDVDGWKKLAKENSEKIDNLEAGLADLTGTGDMFGFSHTNWGSPKQVEAVFNQRFVEQGRTYRVKKPIACQNKRCNLYNLMYISEDEEGNTEEVPACDYHSTFEWVDAPFTISSTKSRVLAQLAADGDELAAYLLKYRKTRKARDTYGYSFLDQYLHSDDRIYPEYHQLGAGATGRMSSSNPNGQNIPHSPEFRSLFVPRAGSLFALSDYSQIELRITVEISCDPSGMRAYCVDFTDLHKTTASMILGVDLKDTSPANLARIKEARQVAKSLNFGLIFGAGSETMRLYAQDAFQVVMDAQRAVELRNAWRKLYSGIVQWQRRAGNGAETTFTLGDRRRINVFKFTEKLNSPVQGTGADGLKAAIALCYETRHQINSEARPVAYVHDELMFEVPAHAAEDTSRWIQKNMEEGMQYFMKMVPVVSEPKVAKDWSEK